MRFISENNPGVALSPVFESLEPRLLLSTVGIYDFSTDGPVGTYPSYLNDTSGNGYDLGPAVQNLAEIISDAPFWSTTNSLEHHNGGVEAFVPTGNESPFQTGKFTWELSARYPSGGIGGGETRLISSFDLGVNGGAAIFADASGAMKVAFRGQASSDFKSANSIIANEVWYHVALTYDGADPDGDGIYTGAARLYVNGTEVASNASANMRLNGSYGIVLGQWIPSTGIVAELQLNNIRISDSVLQPGEFNNGGIAGGSDLHVANITLMNSATAGELMDVKYTVTNTAASVFGNWTDKIYLSSNATLDPGDSLIATVVNSGMTLGENQSYTNIETARIPDSASGGARYIIVYADRNDNLSELDENNNTASESINIYAAPYAVYFDEVSPKPVWGDVNQPYDQLPGTYETYHEDWANPLPEGPLDVLFILPYSNSREVIELSQRLDLNYTVIMTAGSDSWWDGPVNNSVYPGTPIGGTDALNTITQIANERLNPATNTYDAIVIGKVDWSAIPSTYQTWILQHVSAGAGLTYVSSEPNAAAVGSDSNLPIETTFREDLHVSVTGLATTFITNYYGSGRRIAVDYSDTTGNDDSLSANVDYDPVKYDYNMAVLAKAVRWSAGTDAAVDASITVADTIARDSLTATQFTMTASTSGAAIAVQFDYRIRDQYGQTLAQGIVAGNVPAGGSDAASVFLPVLPRGEYRLDLRVLDASGDVLEFTALEFQVTNDEYVWSISTNSDRYTDGDTISGSTTFIKALEASQSAIVRVIDTWGRIAFEGPVSLYGTRTGGTFSIPVVNALSHIWDIEVAIQDAGGLDVDTKDTWVAIPRENFDDYYWGIIFSPMPGDSTWKDNMYSVRVGEFGINGVFTQMIYSRFYQMEATERQNMINLVYADHQGQLNNNDARTGPFNVEFTETDMGEISDMFDYTAETGLLPTTAMFPYLFKQGGGSAPVYYLDANWWGAKLLSYQTQGEKYGTPFFTLTGENYLAGEGPGNDHEENSGFSARSTQQFQEWLQGIEDGSWDRNNGHINSVHNPHPYTSLAQLNSEWNTSFGSWSEVRGVLYNDAVANNQLARWIDFRYFMRSGIWTEFFLDYSRAIQKLSPGTQTGTVGHDHYDFTRMVDQMNSAKIYNLQQNVDELDTMVREELQQSFSGDESYLLGATSMLRWMADFQTPRRNYRLPWKMMFMGFNGFDWENFLSKGTLGGMSSMTPDLSEELPFMANISDQVRVLQSGIGNLANSADPLRSDVAILWSPVNHYISQTLEGSEVNGFSGSWLSNVATDFGVHHDLLAILKSIGIRGTFVSPEQVISGELSSSGYSTLLLPYSKGMSAAEASAITSFVSAGGLVVADNTPGIYTEHGAALSAGNYRLNNLFPINNQNNGINYGSGRAEYMHNGFNDYLNEMKAGNYASADQLASILSQYAGETPPVELLDINNNQRRDTLMPIYVKGSAKYVGMMRHELSEDMEGPTTTVNLDDTYYVFDAINQSYVGQVNSFDINLDMYPKFYALLPAKPTAVTLSLAAGDEAVVHGDVVNVTGTVSFTGTTGISTLGQVVHVTVTDPNGNEVLAYRDNITFEGSTFNFDLPVGYSEAEGTYTITVTNAVTGDTDTETFQVGEGVSVGTTVHYTYKETAPGNWEVLIDVTGENTSGLSAYEIWVENVDPSLVSFEENVLVTFSIDSGGLMGFMPNTLALGDVGGSFNAGNYQGSGDFALQGVGMIEVFEQSAYPETYQSVDLDVPALLGTLTTPTGLEEGNFRVVTAGLLNLAGDGFINANNIIPTLEVIVFALLPGDANRDGQVSAGDYASVQANFGNTGDPNDPTLFGDANLDGVVSAGDYASVQANFGNTAASSQVIESVVPTMEISAAALVTTQDIVDEPTIEDIAPVTVAGSKISQRQLARKFWKDSSAARRQRPMFQSILPARPGKSKNISSAKIQILLPGKLSEGEEPLVQPPQLPVEYFSLEMFSPLAG